MQSLEIIVFVSTIVIAILSGVLAAFMTYKWKNNKEVKSFGFWSLGLWIFTAAVLLESIFSLNLYSEALIDIYLFLVVFLVESLAMGSLYLIKSNGIKVAYLVYILVIDVAMVIALQASAIKNLIITYVVYGPLPLSVVTISSLGTFPAAFILVVVAALSYYRSKNKKMLSIIAGTVVVSIAGTLYIAAVPEFLYYSEFIGILLLWFGFFSFGHGIGAKAKKPKRTHRKPRTAKAKRNTAYRTGKERANKPRKKRVRR
ncbi:hypothetical protein M1567_03040 [Candidatus Marsarchaeota archaeon]|nr:hypothetical protein [Candidatus Marsarchaeota archaeon]